MVGVISEWHERVEPVITTGKLEDDEDRIILARDRLDGEIARAFVELAKGALDKHRHRPSGGGTEDGGTDEIAASFHDVLC